MGWCLASDYFLNRLGEDETDVRWGIMDNDEYWVDNEIERKGACYKYMGRTIKFNDDFQDIPVSYRGKTIDRTFEKIVLPISQDEINANSALESQQNPEY